MNYGFGDQDDSAAISLPKVKKASRPKPRVEAALQAGEELGFVSRGGTKKRKTGPKRTEPQGKVTLTGPQRVLDQLQARCTKMGGVPYWKAIEAMLEETE